MNELLTPAQMALADQLTIERGISGIGLMEAAGQGVVDAFMEHWPEARHVLIVCGIGNNGGDGFVAARLLQEMGRSVRVYVCGSEDRISGDAALAFQRMDRSLLTTDLPERLGQDVIIDALFGAGLARNVTGEHAALISAMNNSESPILAVDLPSGIDGRAGQIMGCAVEASATVTFFRFKPGHILMPGRVHCGDPHFVDIGILESVLDKTGVEAWLNGPDLWEAEFPFPDLQRHKYDRGHTLVISGPAPATGAARLVAGAALRVGSGLVTLASSAEALPINAAHLTSVMLKEANGLRDILAILEDPRFNCIALGPGLPPDAATGDLTLALLELDRSVVLDAGALSAFSNQPDTLFAGIRASKGDVILTPHDGEYARLFSDQTRLVSKVDRAKTAADLSGATIVLKGPDTVIASPDGTVSISENAPPWLATAGSGDVLAGIIAGLLAQGMPAFEAASAGVWLHGDAADRLGPGLISSDLDEGLRLALSEFVLSNTSV